MRNNDVEAHAHDHANTEGQSDYPTHDWRNIVKSTSHDLFDRSWAQNILAGIALLFIAPLLGFLLMSNLRGMLMGAGIGVTILFWIILGTLIKNAVPVKKPELTPIPIPVATPPDKPMVPVVAAPKLPSALPSATTTPQPTPALPLKATSPLGVFPTNLTPKQIRDRLLSAPTVDAREKLGQLCIDTPVDWLLLFSSASPGENTMSVFFNDDEYSGLVMCLVPKKGNEFWPFRPSGDKFRVRAKISDADALCITLKDCDICSP